MKALNFEDFCKKYNYILDFDEANNCYINTHTQSAYMAFLYGLASGGVDVYNYLSFNELMDKQELNFVLELFIDRPLYTLNDILPFSED